MSAEPNLQCPKCGGHDVKDLSGIRRGLGVVLMAGSLLAVALLARRTTPIPSWVLPVAFAVFVLGVASSLGAARARYCPRCNVRMIEPDDRTSERDS